MGTHVSRPLVKTGSSVRTELGDFAEHLPCPWDRGASGRKLRARHGRARGWYGPRRSSTPMPSTARRTPSRRRPGASAPAAFHATGEWLRTAFSDLVWTTEYDVVEDDIVVTYGTLSGRHTGEFVVWTPDAAVEQSFVPTGKTLTVRQAHLQRIADGLVIEHCAVRDDQGMALQLGWIPPTPGFLPLRTRHAARSARARPRPGPQ